MRLLISATALLLVAGGAAGDSLTRETFESQGRKRSYVLFVPDTVKAKAGAPLVILLHGSGRRSLVDHWWPKAKKEGVILAGPESWQPNQWNLADDGPYVFADLVKDVRQRHTIDERRMYVFGHSSGAIMGLMLGLLESEYFAAVAVHAGALPAAWSNVIDMADRKIPFGIWVGTRDPLSPLAAVEASTETLRQKGHDVHLKVIQGHTHNYYDRARDVNDEAWAFLEPHRLPHDPRFKDYVVNR